jgi:hypothetical protein
MRRDQCSVWSALRAGHTSAILSFAAQRGPLPEVRVGPLPDSCAAANSNVRCMPVEELSTAPITDSSLSSDYAAHGVFECTDWT